MQKLILAFGFCLLDIFGSVDITLSMFKFTVKPAHLVTGIHLGNKYYIYYTFRVKARYQFNGFESR
jgi:hypothetical protein